MIVREIKERSADSKDPPPAPPRPSQDAGHGFPQAKHRSKASRFSQQRTALTNVRPGKDEASVRNPGPSNVGGRLERDTVEAGPSRIRLSEAETIRKQVDAENEARVRGMSEEERAQEARELTERFGDGLVDLMRKMRAARDGRAKSQADLQADTQPGTSSLPSSILKAQPDSNTEGQQPDAPGEKGQIQTARRASKQYDLTPSELKERYFPNHPSEPQKLAWLQPVSSRSSSDTSIRFDLSGNILNSQQKESIPTSQGLHHHGQSPDLAGYTMDDVLWLCRSTVPGQRITMLNLLSKIIGKYAYSERGVGSDQLNDIKQLFSKLEVMKKATTFGVEIIMEPPRAIGLLTAGIDLFYQALRGGPSTREEVGQSEHRYLPSTHDVGIDWEGMIPGLQKLLGPRYDLPPHSIERIVLLLRRKSIESSDMGELLYPVLPIALRSHVLDTPWPLNRDRPPSDLVLQFALDLIKSSRSCATSFAEDDLAEPLLRYLVPSTWSSGRPPALCTSVLQIYTALGRYGLAASLATTSREIMKDLGKALQTDLTDQSVVECAVVYFDLLTVWTTCAVDPHRTAPEHSLTWAQISGLGWSDDALDFLAVVSAEREYPRLMTATINLLSLWVTGLQINAPGSVDAEKENICSGLRRLEVGSPIDQWIELGDERPIARTLSSIVSLDNGLRSSRGSAILSTGVRDKLVSGEIAGDDVHLGVASLSSTTGGGRLSRTFALMPKFQPGDEHLALELLDQILRSDQTGQDGSSEAGPNVNLEVLRPLLQYLMLPSADDVVGPWPPTHTYLKATRTLLRPATTMTPGLGLPLPTDWVFSPLNELLRSADSTALAQTPPDWNPSETEIVRATLQLAQMHVSAAASPSRSEILINLMKVFMLENEPNSTTSEGEVFRDTVVSTLIESLLDPSNGGVLTERASTQSSDAIGPLEEVSKAFLGDDRPFFQFYTDFLALFEAISFSDPSFSKLVVPPLAMNYPIDYRRLIWVDHPHVTRILLLKVDQIPLESHEGIKVFFEPGEQDGEVLNAQARALTRGLIARSRNEFMWIVAMSHVSRALWAEDGPIGGGGRSQLLRAIMDSGSRTVLEDLIGLSIDGSGSVSNVDEGTKEHRLAAVEKLLGSEAREKLQASLLL